MDSKKSLPRGGLRAPLFFIIDSSVGFTLVELMVVVAIVGLLSAVAIPNFQKFQARSKTTEAKLQLAAVYTAEASFYGTYHIYHTCINSMGYDPTEFRSSRFYSIGFTNAASLNAFAHGSAINQGLNTADCPESLIATVDQTFFEAGIGVGNVVATSSHIPLTSLGDQTVSDMTFLAGAGGVIYKNFMTSSDSSAFTIDQTKTIVVVRNGY